MLQSVGLRKNELKKINYYSLNPPVSKNRNKNKNAISARYCYIILSIQIWWSFSKWISKLSEKAMNKILYLMYRKFLEDIKMEWWFPYFDHSGSVHLISDSAVSLEILIYKINWVKKTLVHFLKFEVISLTRSVRVFCNFPPKIYWIGISNNE